MDDAIDVLIIGAGAAGMVAGIFASRTGARVLVIEAADRIGGTFHLSSGMISAAGTRIQAEKGIHDTPDLHYEDIMRISRGTANPEIVRLAVDNAADTVHWLLDNGYRPLPDHPIIFYAHEPYRTPRTYWASEGGRAVMDVLVPQYEAEEARGHLETWLSSEFLRLTMDDGGAVTGAIVRRGDVEIRVEARVVILATGGYTANAELFAEFSLGNRLYGGGYRYARGTGHIAAVAAGGQIINQQMFLPGFAGIEDPDAPGGYTGGTVTVPQMRQPWELYLDARGSRFMREDNPSIDARERALLEQPGMTFWVVYDEAIRRSSPPFFTVPDEAVSQRFDTLSGYRKANSLAELAMLTKMDTRILADEIDAYNRTVGSNVPDSMGRIHRPLPIAEPPYYAVRHVGWSVTGFAGIKIDGKLRVLDTSGRPIPNLYAAGEILGMGATSGNSFTGGMSVTPAMTFGRLLGSQLGRAVKNESGCIDGTRARSASHRGGFP